MVAFRDFRSYSGFIWYCKFNYQKFLLRQKIRRKISGVVSRTSFHLWLHLGGEITDLRPWASKLANKSATVKIKSSDFGISTSLSELTLKICRLNSWTTFRFNFFLYPFWGYQNFSPIPWEFYFKICNQFLKLPGWHPYDMGHIHR